MELETSTDLINLNKDQNGASSKIRYYLSSETNIFLLKGYAGTGKTTLIKLIAEYLKEQNKQCILMAPTGRAAKVLSDKTGFEASTIHREIYDFNNLQPIKTDEDDESKSFKFFFRLAQNTYDPGAVFIIDESSMVSDQYAEGEFFRFGSGKLLSDLLSFIDLFSNKNHKIIFIGDPAQLPPVNDPVSRALQESFFQNKGFIVDSYEMTEVIRQKEGSGILANAEKIRKYLELEERNEYSLDLNHPDLEEFKIPSLVDLYFHSSPNHDLNDTTIIAYSNARVHDYNRMIRKRLFPGSDYVTTGDILLITHNNYRHQVILLNGELIKVLWVAESNELQSAPVMVNGKKKTITITFRDIELLVPGHDNPLKCKIIDSYLHNRERDLSPYELKALYINFVMRFRSQNPDLKEDSEEFKLALRSDPYFNAVRAKFGYAITCHKAQGGEWNTVFVDFNGQIGLSESHFRWGYTAITRASRKLFVLDPPNMTPLSVLKVNPIGKIGNIPSQMFQFGDVETTPYHNIKTHPAKRLKYFEIEHKIQESPFCIENVITSDFHEQYYFKLEEKIVRVDMNHDAAGLFTYYHSNDQSEETLQLINLLKEHYDWELPFSYATDNPALQKLYQFVSAISDDAATRIMNVDQTTVNSFFLTYYFKTEADCAYIQFYFNKKGQITSAIPKSTLGSEDEILSALCIKLQNI